MEPHRNSNATLVDLLDRVLDKGLVIHADLVVSVAGIPLIGVNLRAALAGMETMLEYGVMQAWDEKTRAWEREHWKKNLPSLAEGEEIALKMYGSYYHSKGIYNAWRPGYFYLTNRRILLHQQDFDEIIFQVPLKEIRALGMKEEEDFVEEKKKQVLYMIDKQDRVHRLSAVEPGQLKDAVEQQIVSMGLYLEDNPTLSDSGNSLEQWHGILRKIITGREEPVAGDETETCPQCGRSAFIEVLLQQGCSRCGWMSPNKKVVSEQISVLS